MSIDKPTRSGGVMILAGGTGGHIFPGLAVARALADRHIPVSWLGTPHGLENRLVPAAGIDLERVRITGLRGRGMLGWLAAPLRVVRAMFQARRILHKRRPGCVLSMGGYAAGPGGLMARLMGIPLVVHEQNAIAGLTNRLLAPLARRVCSGFPDTLRRARFTGNPVRAEIASLPHPETRYGSRTGPLNLLVIGGSQGARIFNQVVPEALARVPAENRPVVLHQAGKQQQQARKNYEQAGVQAEVTDFVDDMAGAWARADFAICRSGALTVAELAAAGVPAVLVPFSHAVDDHQFANAGWLSECGAAWRIRETDFTAGWLADHIQGLNRAGLGAMAATARARARTDAAGQVAEVCREVLA